MASDDKLGITPDASRAKRFSSCSHAHMNLLQDVVAYRITHLRPWFLDPCLQIFFVLHIHLSQLTNEVSNRHPSCEKKRSRRKSAKLQI